MDVETTPSAKERQVIFAVFAFVSTVPIFFSGYFLATTVILLRSSNPSDGSHPRLDMDLAFAIFAVLVSLMASAAVIWRQKPLAITCGVIWAIVVLLFFVITGNVTMNVSRMDPLEEYPRWFRNFLLNDNDWGAFQRHIIQEKFCKEDVKSGDLTQLFLLGGCCDPRDYCGYQEKNKTWIVPKSGQYYQENNCLMWSNDVDKMCYYCNSCKAAYLYRYVQDNLFSRGEHVMIAGLFWICSFGFVFGD